jgi:hypothetical protein
MANEFVARKGVISLGGLTFPYYPTSVNYTVSPDDFFIDILLNDVTVELPNAIGIEGKQYAIRNTSTGDTTVSCFSAQTIEGDTTITLGKGNTIQVVSDNTQWKISNVGGPIRTATNNSLLTSDGTIGGVNANTGLTFDGQTLSVVSPQTSGTPYIESYGYKVTGLTVTTAYTNENKIFTYENTGQDLVFIDFESVLERSGGSKRAMHIRRHLFQTGTTSTLINSTQFNGTLVSGIVASGNTDTIELYVRSTSGTETIDSVTINVRFFKS